MSAPRCPAALCLSRAAAGGQQACKLCSLAGRIPPGCAAPAGPHSALQPVEPQRATGHPCLPKQEALPKLHASWPRPALPGAAVQAQGCACTRRAPPGVYQQPSPWAWIDPGAFALIGAGAFMGGVTRLTISLAVIMMEACPTAALPSARPTQHSCRPLPRVWRPPRNAGPRQGQLQQLPLPWSPSGRPAASKAAR